MRKSITVCLGLAILLYLASGSHAALTIIVGNQLLQPNQAGQEVDIYINALGGEQIQGINFRAQEGDGGPAVGGFDTPLPLMTGSITAPGSLFENNNNIPLDYSLPPGYVDWSTATAFGFITLSPGNNLLGTLTFDTTGFTSGSWPLIMTGTAGGDTNTSGGPDLFIENGSITVIPEPGSVLLGLFAIIGFGEVAIRKRRAHRA